MIFSKNALDIIGKMCYTYEYRITLILKRGKHMKRLITFLLASSLLLAAGCGSSSGSTVTAPPSGDTTTEAADPDSFFPNEDFGGAEVSFLNFDQLWNMYIHVDAAELNADVLNDAVFNRNRKVEQKLGCKIVEKTVLNEGNALSLVTDAAKTSIMSGEDEYDAMMLPISETPYFITDGYLQDLGSMPEFDFGGEWWDQEIIKSTTFGGKSFIASGAANLMAFDSMWCLFFNEKMMADHQLDTPYQLVRDGKWTIDELTKYCKAAASLNGDESYTWSKDGSCVYGISSHQNSPEHFWFSAGEMTLNTSGSKPEIILGGDRFYSVMDKLALMLSGKDGLTLKASNTDFDAENGGYVHVFTVSRALFMTGEIKAAQLMRSMPDTFGIVPFPKFDENQDDYITSLVSQLFYFTIPVTSENAARTATVYEAMTHESYVSVIPQYYGNVVEQKGLRNEESIEMLEILRRTREVDVATIFNWSKDIRSSLNSMLFNGESTAASIIDANKSTLQAEMDKFFEYIEQK